MIAKDIIAELEKFEPTAEVVVEAGEDSRDNVIYKYIVGFHTEYREDIDPFGEQFPELNDGDEMVILKLER